MEICQIVRPARKFFLALIYLSCGMSARQDGSWTKELAEMSSFSSWEQLVSSDGSAEIRLLERFNSEDIKI